VNSCAGTGSSDVMYMCYMVQEHIGVVFARCFTTGNVTIAVAGTNRRIESTGSTGKSD
jgi:hypothetical protein